MREALEKALRMDFDADCVRLSPERDLQPTTADAQFLLVA